MISYPILGVVAMVFVVVGILAAAVSVGVLIEFFVRNRRDRLAHQESMRTHYRRLVLTP